MWSYCSTTVFMKKTVVSTVHEQFPAAVCKTLAISQNDVVLTRSHTSFDSHWVHFCIFFILILHLVKRGRFGVHRVWFWLEAFPIPLFISILFHVFTFYFISFMLICKKHKKMKTSPNNSQFFPTCSYGCLLFCGVDFMILSFLEF